MENKAKNFLQSAEWRGFQKSVGRKTFFVESNGSASSADRFSASLIEHDLPIVGKYFYCPRGPIFSAEAERILNSEFRISNEFPMTNDQISNGFKIQNSKFKIAFSEIIKVAKENNAGWVRIDPENENILNLIKENTDCKIVRAPHDMQPKEIFVIDISKNNEDLLSEMSQKTRYNIRLAQKKEVKVFAITNNQDTRFAEASARRARNKQISNFNDQKSKEYFAEEFLRLTKEMAIRQGITTHPEEYYRKMIESLPEEMLKIYVAEYDGPASTREDDHSSTRGGKIIAANLILFYGDTATYLHGASGNEHRNVMAPYLLQWQAILDAKEKGYKFYDFGGVKSKISNKIPASPASGQNSKFKIQNSSGWSGITRFKLGFSLSTKPLEFPGSYDIIINPRVYLFYKVLQKAKALIYKIRK